MIRLRTWAGSSFAYTSLYSALRKTPGKTVTSPKRFSNDPRDQLLRNKGVLARRRFRPLVGQARAESLRNLARSYIPIADQGLWVDWQTLHRFCGWQL